MNAELVGICSKEGGTHLACAIREEHFKAYSCPRAIRDQASTDDFRQDCDVFTAAQNMHGGQRTPVVVPPRRFKKQVSDSIDPRLLKFLRELGRKAQIQRGIKRIHDRACTRECTWGEASMTSRSAPLTSRFNPSKS